MAAKLDAASYPPLVLDVIFDTLCPLAFPYPFNGLLVLKEMDSRLPAADFLVVVYSFEVVAVVYFD